MTVALYHARRIVDGAASPYQGAQAIWWGAANDAKADNGPNWDKLSQFVYLASESDNDPSNRDAYANDIIDAARELLRTSGEA
ncbi:MAG: hypothetical protein JSU95_07825 [Betaproteobacteria bacterium]|nr:MAG: hypothetical protein JSU95_07825 [Betaproteobacteria bacterium]